MSAATDQIDALKAEVARDTAVMSSASTLIRGINGMVADAVAKALANGATAEQLAPLTEMQAALKSGADDLSQAVTDNTPSVT